MINWCYYPRSDEIPEHLKKVVKVFEKNKNAIISPPPPEKNLASNVVLEKIREDLEAINFVVEQKGKKIDMDLFGLNGKIKKSFNPDTYDKNTGTVIEVEAGRGYANNQFLKDLFEACLIPKIDYLVTAVKNEYIINLKPKDGVRKFHKSKDYQEIKKFYDTLYASNRLKLPLTGTLIIGYG